MLKKALFSIISLGMLVSLVYHPAKATLGHNMTPGQVVAEAFAASGAQVTEINVQTWAKINNSYLTVAELVDLGRLVVGTFDQENILPEIEDWQVTSGEALGQRQVELRAATGMEEIAILLQSLTITGEAVGPGETYLVVMITAAPAAGIVKLEYQTTNAFSPFQLIPRQAVLYTGFRAQSIDKEGKSQLINHMLGVVKGKKVEGIEEDFLASYSGYTPLIADTWWAGAEEINLQIAVRDYSNGSRTLIYVGYPLILTGY
ncbi:MAG: YwmB family TATA-box binding protein [Clostridia bacterium]|nr:YwmB family TATA-box binding protein [Clostridia bacterium]